MISLVDWVKISANKLSVGGRPSGSKHRELSVENKGLEDINRSFWGKISVPP
jgi:hypothetical protein